MADLPDIDSPEKLEAWLRGKPREWAQVIAMRAALRVLPLVGEVLAIEPGKPEHESSSILVCNCFRASVVSWLTRTFSFHASHSEVDMTSLAAAGAEANSRASDCSAYISNMFPAVAYSLDASGIAAYIASLAADLTKSTATVAEFSVAAIQFSIENKYSGPRFSHSENYSTAGIKGFEQRRNQASIWKEIAADALWLENRLAQIRSSPDADQQPEPHAAEMAKDLAFITLWVESRPEWVNDALNDLSQGLQETGIDWRHWIGWYSRRLKGTSTKGLHPDLTGQAARDFDLRVATQPAKWWDRGPQAVNADIARWIEETRLGQPVDTIPPILPASVRPAWVNDKVTQDRSPASTVMADPIGPAALASLREEMRELAEEVETAGNIDCRPATFLRRTADLIPDQGIDTQLLFRLIRREAQLADFEMIAREQWPDFLGSRYGTINREFGEALDQFPERRAFRRHLLQIDIDELPAAHVDVDMARIVMVMRSELGQARIDDSIPQVIESIAIPEANDDVPMSTELDRIVQADRIESANSTLKRLAEHAFDDEKSKEIMRRIEDEYAAGVVEGIPEGAREAGRKDGQKIGAGLARTRAGKAAASKLSQKYPRAFGWLRRFDL
jgi:hypothetical protein